MVCDTVCDIVCDTGLRKSIHLVLTFDFSREFFIRIFTKYFIQPPGLGIIENPRTFFIKVSSSFLNALGKCFPFGYDVTVFFRKLKFL
jgi:hypothetical protein